MVVGGTARRPTPGRKARPARGDALSSTAGGLRRSPPPVAVPDDRQDLLPQLRVEDLLGIGVQPVPLRAAAEKDEVARQVDRRPQRGHALLRQLGAVAGHLRRGRWGGAAAQRPGRGELEMAGRSGQRALAADRFAVAFIAEKSDNRRGKGAQIGVDRPGRLDSRIRLSHLQTKLSPDTDWNTQTSANFFTAKSWTRHMSIPFQVHSPASQPWQARTRQPMVDRSRKPSPSWQRGEEDEEEATDITGDRSEEKVRSVECVLIVFN